MMKSGVDETDEDFVFYGTPIEREEELSNRKRKKSADSGSMRSLPTWKQEVTDSEGRRRFHGAFTGGFSAGYYNTVGSKEGWSPQTFTSSRTKRAEVKEQTIYSFLDEDEKAGIICREKLSSICAIKRALMDRMTMGSLRSRTIAGWILEFVLRQPIDDWIVNRLVTVLPLPDDDIRLKKSILLRRISSEVSKGTISEKILDSLEMVEELDSISPMISSEAATSSMRTAYGYVVVASILSFLGDNPDDELGDYYSAMQRIWTERISKMELVSSMGFFPRCWKEVRMELEAVVVAVAGGERVHTYELKKEAVRVALESLQAFLVIAARDLGLPFLGVVSGYVQGKHHDLDGFWTSVVSSILETDQRACAPMPEDNISSPHQPPSNGCGPKQEASAALMQGDAPNRNGGVSHVPMIGDSNLGDGIRLMQTQAIHNVQAALKSSALNLQLAVEDPLPNALEMVRQMENKSKIGCEDRNSKASKEIPHNALGDPKAMGEATEIGHSEQPNTGNLRGTSSEGQCTHSYGRMIKPSLFDRNKTAQTYEWDSESTEPLLEKSQSHSRAIHLPSPKKLKISPLQRQDVTRYTRRRKIRRWSPFEEETLRDAVKKCGVGSWKFILNCHREVFEGRTEIDLKDKWRNMTRP